MISSSESRKLEILGAILCPDFSRKKWSKLMDLTDYVKVDGLV